MPQTTPLSGYMKPFIRTLLGHQYPFFCADVCQLWSWFVLFTGYLHGLETHALLGQDLAIRVAAKFRSLRS